MEDIKKVFNRLVRYDEDTKGVGGIQFGSRYNADNAIKDIKTVEQALDDYKVLKGKDTISQVDIECIRDDIQSRLLGFEIGKPIAKCPHCHNELQVLNSFYCHNCGKRLSWKFEG